MILPPLSRELGRSSNRPLLHQTVLLALNTGDVVPSGVLEWQTDLTRTLIELGAHVDVSHSDGAGRKGAAESFGALGLDIITETKYPSERTDSGWLPPRYHAGDVVRQVAAKEYDLILVHGINLAKTICGGGHFADRLWSIIEDAPDQRLDLVKDIAKLESVVAGSRRLVVYAEESRSQIEAVLPSAAGKTCVFPPLLRRSGVLDIANYNTELPIALIAPLFSDVENLNRLIIDTLNIFKKFNQEIHMFLIGSNAEFRILLGENGPIEKHLTNAVLVGETEFNAQELSTQHRLIGISDERTNFDDNWSGWFSAHGIRTIPSSHFSSLLGHTQSQRGAVQEPLESAIEQRALVNMADAKTSLARILDAGVADYVSIPPQNEPTNVLLVGADFKFAGDLIDTLMQRRDINLRADVWKNNYTPQPDQSNELIDWADVIICEFSNRNAIWYANNLRPGQKLIVRLHGYELRSEWIDDLNIDKVNMMVFVSEFYREEAIKQKRWERSKTVVIPNSINVADLSRPKLNGSKFHLGLVGIVPILKRPDRALDLLEQLLEFDDRYTLHIRGHAPWNYKREWQKPAHQAAYREFYGRIARNPRIRQNVAFEEFGSDMASWYRKIGWILSPSYRETFHLSPVEGMASGAIPIVWQRDGASEVFPKDCVFDDTQSAGEGILFGNSDELVRNQWISRTKNFVNQYSSTRIGEVWLKLINSLS